MENRKILICECHSLEHQYSFWFDEEENLLYCEPHLTTNRNFFGRLIYGIKYIFGYKSRFGSWDEFLFKHNDVDKLIEILNKIKTNGNN